MSTLFGFMGALLLWAGCGTALDPFGHPDTSEDSDV